MIANFIDIDAELQALKERKAKLLQLAELRAEVELLQREQCAEFDGVVGKVINAVGSKRRVSADILISSCRRRWVCESRFIAVVLIRKHTPMSLHAIGRVFNRDHGTVLHAMKAAEKLADSDAAFRKDLDAIETEVFGLRIARRVDPTKTSRNQ
jgi:chromosomal replication initiation ATPase DnaA